LNYKFNDVQSGIATEAAFADELSAAKFRLAGRRKVIRKEKNAEAERHLQCRSEHWIICNYPNKLLKARISFRNILNYKFNDVQSGIATEAA